MALGDLFGSMPFIGGNSSGGGVLGLLNLAMIVIGTFVVIGGIVFYFWKRSQWNIKKVYFKIPRDVKYLSGDDEIDIDKIQCSIDKETGKGQYDTKRGVVFLKRKGKKKVPMKPFNIAKYLQADGSLEVVQIGADQYLPVIPQSYTLCQDTQTGERSILVNLNADKSESKAWKESFERNAKQAFSIVNLLQQYQVPIMIGLVIVLWGIQLLILYNKIT